MNCFFKSTVIYITNLLFLPQFAEYTPHIEDYYGDDDYDYIEYDVYDLAGDIEDLQSKATISCLENLDIEWVHINNTDEK